MARYRKRKQGSIAEGVAGLLLIIGALAVLNKGFKDQLVVMVRQGISIVLFVGILVLIWYLFRLLKSAKEGSPVSRVNTKSSLSPVSQFVAAHPLLEPVQHEIYAPQKEAPEPPKLKWDNTVLPSIEWKRFEIVTREFLRMAGYEAQETNTGADGGVDIRITKPTVEGFKGVVQCKAWNTYKVGVKPVRELFGIMAAERISYGMVITSGGFTAEAEEFATGKMKLISGTRFLELIYKLPQEKQEWLLGIALEGDYRTPTCPQCDVKMALRESKKGRNLGGQFWGCVNYPRCKQTLVYKLDLEAES